MWRVVCTAHKCTSCHLRLLKVMQITVCRKCYLIWACVFVVRRKTCEVTSCIRHPCETAYYTLKNKGLPQFLKSPKISASDQKKVIKIFSYLFILFQEMLAIVNKKLDFDLASLIPKVMYFFTFWNAFTSL